MVAGQKEAKVDKSDDRETYTSQAVNSQINLDTLSPRLLGPPHPQMNTPGTIDQRGLHSTPQQGAPPTN